MVCSYVIMELFLTPNKFLCFEAKYGFARNILLFAFPCFEQGFFMGGGSDPFFRAGLVGNESFFLSLLGA